MDYVVGKAMVLSDSELRFLSETTPFTEGSGLLDFQQEAENMTQAATREWANMQDARAKWLFLLRGFYFLGVLRGGEAYRNTLLERVQPDHPEIEPLIFSLDEGCSQLFCEDLARLQPTELNQICALVGM